jgi:hypothetical protein
MSTADITLIGDYVSSYVFIIAGAWVASAAIKAWNWGRK